MTRPSWSRDPALPGLLLFGLLTVSGFVVIALGWRAAARTLLVSEQVPALVSGGMGGLALVVSGCALVGVQLRRRQAAQECKETEQLLDELAALVEEVRAR